MNDVSEMKAAMKDMAAAVQKIAVLDTKMAGQNGAIERAFSQIAELNKNLKEHSDEQRKRDGEREAENLSEHIAFRKAINIAIGGGIVIQAVAGFSIMYCVNIISNLVVGEHEAALQLQSVKAQVAQHLQEDHLMSEEDLRRTLNNMRQGIDK
jgi:hypothetical protein